MRLSRGRSTPTRRAMWRSFVVSHSGVGRVASRAAPSVDGRRAPATAPEVASPVVRRASDHDVGCSVVVVPGAAVLLCSALALLVARVLADDHDAAVATDHLALVTDRLDAGVDLQGRPLLGWWRYL